jgi:hypothetical protein
LRDHIAGDSEIQATVGRPIRECYEGVERIKAGGRAGVIFVVSFGGEREHAREGKAHRSLRHGRGCIRRVEGGKWRERVVGKAAGDECIFIPGRWQMKPGQTPYQDAAGGE